MESRQGPVVAGIDPVLTQIQERLRVHPKQWLGMLQRNFGTLGDVEQEVHRVFAQMADQVVAGLLAEATADPAVAKAAEKK